MVINRRRLREKQEVARELRRGSTPEEKVLWQHVRRNQIAGQHFRRQHVLSGFIADFYCPAARLVVELDGAHHGDQEQADRERDAALAGTGAMVLRFSNPEVRENLASVLKRIEGAVVSRCVPRPFLP